MLKPSVSSRHFDKYLCICVVFTFIHLSLRIPLTSKPDEDTAHPLHIDKLSLETLLNGECRSAPEFQQHFMCFSEIIIGVSAASKHISASVKFKMGIDKPKITHKIWCSMFTPELCYQYCRIMFVGYILPSQDLSFY